MTQRFLTLLFCLVSTLPAQFTRGPYMDGDCPPFVFLSMPTTTANFGFDVADQFRLGSPNRLMFMASERDQPVRLIPYAGNKGAVVEPHVYGDWVIFGFIPDVKAKNIAQPCELYALNIRPALDDPTGFDPLTLPIAQLTFSPKTKDGVIARGFNPTQTPQQFWVNGLNSHPAMNVSPCVVEEEHGPVLFWVSNERRANGYGLYAGELVVTADTIRLLGSREIQQFGTTSLIGFTPSPLGALGSYQSSIESTGQWSIFEFYSDEGFWDTVSGYANEVNIADHGATVVAMSADPMDGLVVVSRYYINNNEGFGTLLVAPYRDKGANDDAGTMSVSQRNQRNLFPGISSKSDNPSKQGKFAMPISGRRGELFATYSTNCSNTRTQCSPQPFHAVLVAVPDITGPIMPRHGEQSTFANPAYDASVGVPWVLSSETQHCFYMRPIIARDPTIVRPLFGLAKPARYMPAAKVQAGPIWNTDVKPYRTRAGKYDPTTIIRNGNANRVETRFATLTKDIAPSLPDVAGLRLFITDPTVARYYGPLRKIETGSGVSYLHHRGSDTPAGDGDGVVMERVRLLGDVPIASDGTIAFTLPSNVAVRFDLIGSDGTVLAAHRGHHSFAAGQTDARCIGCHNHVDPPPPLGIAFGEDYRATDTLTKTGRFHWDAEGKLQWEERDEPSLPVPEWKADIWPLVQAECASCHSGQEPGFNIAAPIRELTPKAVNIDRPTAVWSWLHNKRLISPQVGAAKSPFAWYFAGRRLDGEPNERYRGDPKSRYWLSTENHPGIDPVKAYTVLRWIDAGAGIDHDPGGVGGINADHYQITARLTLIDDVVRVGWWDATGDVVKITLKKNAAVVKEWTSPTTKLLAFPLPGLVPTDRLQLEIVDAGDNRFRTDQPVNKLLIDGGR